MLACKSPKSLSKGDVYFSFEGISFNDGSTSIEAHEWHVRSVQNRSTYIEWSGLKLRNTRRKAVMVSLVSKKQGVTWVKGAWAKYIPKAHKMTFEVSDRLPEGIYTTKLQAIKFAVQKWEADISWYENKIPTIKAKREIAQYEEDLACLKKELKLLKSRLTKLNK
ncbi:hypothetical protein [Shewanella colwelliana]|uniref:hypothetical protein n=1 Tax=Shewanella colwelliana TaxID=23 RepID=UPI0022AF7F28|nr:hypothetical protein [Shewanella colwelliana]MCZ4337663.1 hypothetical protein [Shewanella colwelliana]